MTLNDSIVIAAALIVGIVIGAGAAALLMRRMARRGSPESTPVVLDAEMDAEIVDGAQAWATARGVPAAAPLVADKLRLAYGLEAHRRGRPRRRRWRS